MCIDAFLRWNGSSERSSFRADPCLTCLDVFDKGWPSSAVKWTSRAGVENPWTRQLLTSFIMFVPLQKHVFVSSCLIFPDLIPPRMNICHSLLTNGRHKCNNTLAWWICSLMFFCGIYKKKPPSHLFSSVYAAKLNFEVFLCLVVIIMEFKQSIIRIWDWQKDQSAFCINTVSTFRGFLVSFTWAFFLRYLWQDQSFDHNTRHNL